MLEKVRRNRLNGSMKNSLRTKPKYPISNIRYIRQNKIQEEIFMKKSNKEIEINFGWMNSNENVESIEIHEPIAFYDDLGNIEPIVLNKYDKDIEYKKLYYDDFKEDDTLFETFIKIFKSFKKLLFK